MPRCVFRASRRAKLGLVQMLEHTDVATTIVQRMNAYEALLCSMVCVRLRKLVDSHAANAFQRNLEMRLWSPVQRMSMQFTLHERYGYMHFEYHSKPEDWYQIAKTCMAQRGSVARLLCVFRVPIEYLACEALSDRARREKEVSVEVSEWKIADASRVEPWSQDENSSMTWLKSVTRRHCLMLQARKFSVMDGGVKAQLSRAIVLTVHDAPLHRRMSARARFVLNNVFNCMYCYQRKRMLESLDATSPEHAVLCAVCWQDLFVPVANLKSRYKAHLLPDFDARLQACDIVHYTASRYKYRISMVTLARKHTPCVLKSELAAAFDSPSWEHFLAANRSAARGTKPHMRFKYTTGTSSA